MPLEALLTPNLLWITRYVRGKSVVWPGAKLILLLAGRWL